MKFPFPVNIWLYVFTHVIASLRQLNVAVTLPEVLHVVEYTIFAVGAVMSIIHPVLITVSSALCIINITSPLCSLAFGVEMFFMTPAALSADK